MGGCGNQTEDQVTDGSIHPPSLPHLGRVGMKVAKQRSSAPVERQGLMSGDINE